MTNEADFNWTEELSGELEDYHFWYSVGNSPEQAKQLVTATVYQTLAGHDVSSREQDRFIADSTNIKDEQTEVVARGLMDQMREMLSGSNGYQFEWDEAKSQGQRAEQAVKEGREWMGSYDYWQMRPVKSTMSLFQKEEHPGHYFLSSELPEVGELKGLPYNLLSRDYKAEDVARGRLTVPTVEFFRQAAVKLGANPDEIFAAMYEREQNMVFVQAMNKVGHTNFDRVRSAIVDSGSMGSRGRRQYTAAEQFAMLSKREQELVQQPWQERMNGNINHVLRNGSSEATLNISMWTEGQVWYSPDTHSMRGRVTPTDHDAIYMRLRPQLTPQINHGEFLGIRRNAQQIATDLGFAPKPRIIW